MAALENGKENLSERVVALESDYNCSLGQLSSLKKELKSMDDTFCMEKESYQRRIDEVEACLRGREDQLEDVTAKYSGAEHALNKLRADFDEKIVITKQKE